LPLYTFYCWSPDRAAALSIEAGVHESDEQAVAASQRILAQHSTCHRVEVFDGDRAVGEAVRA
jgi:hypothetical protein